MATTYTHCDSRGVRQALRVVLISCTSALLLTGCYYTQAIRGHADLMSKREPIDDVVASPDTPEDLASRLELVLQARQFSIDVLKLPDNDSYRSYADLERDYVVWNVFATPEFSLRPKKWCYPVVGCVSYRGYFSERKARDVAAKLDARGFDVAVGGATAYSTLGKFDDPVLNTMLRWDDTRLVAVLFHELAHQVVYVKGDTGFNESFATAVEEYGVVRWLQARGDAAAVREYWERRELRQDMMRLVSAARDDLMAYFSETLDDDEKRLLKQHRLDELQDEIARVMREAGRDPGAWATGRLNNARLVSMNLYEGRLPEFRRLLADCEQDPECFYARVTELAARQP